MGLLQITRDAVGANCYYLSVQGLAVIGKKTSHPYEVSYTTNHALLVGRVCSWLKITEGADPNAMLTDAILRANGANQRHRPDIVLGRKAFEVELNHKPLGILMKNIQANDSYGSQVWITPDSRPGIARNLLACAKKDCRILDSAGMTLEAVIAAMEEGEGQGWMTVRLHTGDPSVYGAIREQMDILSQKGLAYDVVPGVSSFCAAAASLQAEYTLPGISQSVIITRMEGRTPVPDKQKIADYAAHQATMVIFLSASLLEGLQAELLRGGYSADTPAAIVYKASWPEERTYTCTVGTLAETAQREGISKTALIVVGQVLGQAYDRSLLYHPAFTHGCRQAAPDEQQYGDHIQGETES